jgi:opacity protein-like surface antigen
MANKKFFLGMLVVALAFGMTVIGCDEPEDPDNPFKGEWTGTFAGGDATISFTDSTWTLTYGTADPQKGKYTPGISKVYLRADQGSGRIGDSTYSKAGILTVTIYEGDDENTGTFTRIKKALSDPFVGEWSGKYTPSGSGSTEADATFTFTADTWTLTLGEKTATGTYTKSAIGLTATLKISGIGVGSAVLLNPIDGKLRVDLIQSNVLGTNGSGSFERVPAATP